MIKRVTTLVTEVERNLLKLVLMASQVDRFAGIEHDQEVFRQQKNKKNFTPRVKVRRFMPINVKTLYPDRMMLTICYPASDSDSVILSRTSGFL